MPDGLAIPLFYLIAAGVWVYFKVTTSRERQSALEWFIIAVLVFGGAGLLYTLFSSKSIAPTGSL